MISKSIILFFAYFQATSKVNAIPRSHCPEGTYQANIGIYPVNGERCVAFEGAECGPNEVLNSDASECVEKPKIDCPYGFIPYGDRCSLPRMHSICPHKMVWDSENYRCIENKCNARQKVLRDYSCEYCPDL